MILTVPFPTVLSSTYPPPHCNGRELGAIVAQPDPRDTFRCAWTLVDTGMTSADAIKEAIGPWGKPYIRTQTPEDLDRQLGAWAEKWLKVNEDLIARNEKALFRCVFRCHIFQYSTALPLGLFRHYQVPHAPSLRLPLFCSLTAAYTYRTRRGPQPSTMEAVENVRACVRKGCLSSGLSLKDQYSVDRIGPQTGLRSYHKRIGTGKNECLHR